jgi:hypothetical protein
MTDATHIMSIAGIETPVRVIRKPDIRGRYSRLIFTEETDRKGWGALFSIYYGNAGNIIDGTRRTDIHSTQKLTKAQAKQIVLSPI